MAIAEERESPRALDSQEIKSGIKYFVSEALDKCLGRMGGVLYGCAYSDFKGKISVDLVLGNFGEETPISMEIEAGEFEGEGVETGIDIEIPKMPPNQFRQETDQPVVVSRMEDGKRVEKRIKYDRRPAKKAAKKAAKN